MPPNVVAGAVLTCSMGVAPGTLTPLPRPVMIEKRPVATIMDHVPMVNISPFGMCNSMSNPAVLAATIAAGGTPTPSACVPVTPAPWVPGAPTSMVMGQPALTASSQCMCAWAGVITITQPGTISTQSD